MSSKLKKTNAFTLSELLVVLVISGIVVSISLFALENVQKQLKSLYAVFEIQQTMNRLERIMIRDLNSFDARYHAEEKALVFRNSQETIVYQIKDTYILRNKDSIQLSPKKIRFYLDGKEVRSGVIDALEFSFVNTYTQTSFFGYKIKDAAHYINKPKEFN